VVERGFTLNKWVDLCSTASAKLFGMFPKKGTIAVGSDADLVIIDPNLERRVDAADLQGMSDFSAFENKVLRGWPIMTIKGGTIIARDHRIVAPANGRYLPRAPAAAPDLAWLATVPPPQM
jgi:dihydroorotase-like cyclic amidohydrolase